MRTPPTYVLITPARNEADLIALTIDSMVAQTVRPLKWIIVSDGSTDNTDDIVRKYLDAHPWMELVRTPERQERHFAGKVYAFNAGYTRVAELDYDIIGNLDADLSFDPDYIEILLMKFVDNPKLGIAGTSYKEVTASNANSLPYDYRFASVEHVPGGCQMFRRKCFEEIGGYAPIKGGLVDTVAVMAARMKGWQTRTFTDKMFLHHRESGTAGHGVLMARFKRGEKNYALGNHPVWELFRTVYQLTKKPFIVGGLVMLCGYLWSAIRRVERPVSEELVAFHRREQMQRFRQFFTGRWITGRKTWEQDTTPSKQVS